MKELLNNRIFPWGHGRRFNSLPEYYRRTYGTRLQKVSVDAGFTCPNRDGSRGTGGCTYCENRAFNPSYCTPAKSITRQVEEGIEFHRSRYRKASSYLVYFQAYSNTYAPTGILESLYTEALANKEVKGLVIGTRPDCLNDEVLDLLADFSSRCILTVELGIESCYDRTLERINRGHTFGEAVEALKALESRGIQAGAHFIFGLPGESIEDMLAEARVISGLPLDSVKFHQLQVIKGTAMEKEFRDKPSDFVVFSREEYLDFIISFLENLNPAIIVERFTGEAPPRFLEQSLWGELRTDQIIELIVKRMEELDTWQGRLYKP